jgi:hypothetical protein
MTGIARVRVPALLPVQLRLDGLRDRQAHARQMGTKANKDLADGEGTMAAIHLADMYDVSFTDAIKIIVDGSIRPLCALVTGGPE